MRHVYHPRCAGERGLVLVPVLIVALVIGGLAMSLVDESMGERTSVRHHNDNLVALELCEVGLVKAEVEICTGQDRDDDGLGNVSGTVQGGSYEVRARKVAGLMRTWVLEARGESGLSVRRVEVGIRVRGGPFTYALFGKESVDLQGGGQTDSYDSRDGTYAEQAVNGAGTFDGVYAKANGRVGSNLDVRLWARTVVRGDAHPGPTGSFSGSPEKVWGELSKLEQPVDLPPTPLDHFLDALARNRNHTIDPTARGITYDPLTYDLRVGSGGELVLDGGSYFFTELTTNGNGRIRVTKPTRLYVTGIIDLGGGALINGSGRASDLLVYAHPYDIVPGYTPDGSRALEMSGGVSAAFAVYAPEMDIKAGGGNDAFGAVVGRNVELQGGSLFHYDEALADFGMATGRLAVRLYWVELGTHNY